MWRQMARPAWLEHATLCLEGRCSIQLSYGRFPIISHKRSVPSTVSCGVGPVRKRELWAATQAEWDGIKRSRLVLVGSRLDGNPHRNHAA
jgi:hypothetical protein